MASDHPQQRSRSGSEKRQRQGLIAVRVCEAERRMIQEAASREGVPVGKFIRQTILAVAEKA